MILFLKEAFGLLRAALTVKEAEAHSYTGEESKGSDKITIQAKEGQAVSCAWRPQRREGGTLRLQTKTAKKQAQGSRMRDKTLVSIKGDRNGASAIS